jgi:osmotically-inducible protein OsmY
MEQQANRADAKLQQDVARELDWDSRVSPTEVGVVTVHGQVENLREREAILGAVRGTRGVRGVSDQLSVRRDV